MRIIISFLFFLTALVGKSQEHSPDFHRFGLLIGGQQTHMLDQQFSPLIHTANEFSGMLWYEAKHRRSNWNVGLNIAMGSLFPAGMAGRTLYHTTEDIEGNVTIDSTLIRGLTRTALLQAGYIHDITTSRSWMIGAGVSVRNQLMYPSTFTNMGILNSASILIHLHATLYSGRKTEWAAAINTPVAGFNTRFPYSGTVSLPNQTLIEAFFDGGTRFVLPDRYQQLNGHLTWRLAISQCTGIGLRYDFMWQRYEIPVPLKSYSQRIGTFIQINL